MNEDYIVDFDDGLPWEVREALCRSPICRKYLAERKRIGRIAAVILATGGSLNDPRLQRELAAFQPLLDAVQQERQRCMQAAGGELASDHPHPLVDAPSV